MKYYFLLAVLLSFFFASAQNAKRPVVGLVMSGGGAKGMAHVGSLKILDSLGIHIDYVAGTSMGSVVGGLYAIGYTEEQIKDEILNADWSNLMSDLPKREYLSVEEKDQPQRYIFTTALKGTKVHIPSGILSGNNIEAKLNQLFIGYQEETNFLKLPRGFVCVAADLNQAEEVAFTHGSLPGAIRASMSIPSMFDPYEMDGRVLIDGGTINNFPSDQLKALGCDIIIGFDVQTVKSDTVKKPSITKVLEKTSMFINFASSAERESYCDIIIKPNMMNYGVTSFADYKAIYHEGKLAARNKMDELIKLSEYLKQWEFEEPSPYEKRDSIYVNSLSIKGNHKISDKLIQGIFNVEAGEYYQIEYLEEELKQLYGTNNFQKVKYDLLKTDTADHFDMIIRIVESPTNTDIGVGIHIDSDFGAQALVNFTNRSFLLEGSKLGVDFIIREYPYLKFYYYYDRGLKPGFGFYSRYYSALPNIYRGKSFQGQVGINDWSNALYVQSTSLNRALLKAGIQLDFQKYNFEKFPFWEELVGTEKLSLRYFNLFVRLAIDNLDDSNYPNKGMHAFIEAKAHELQSNSFELFNIHPFYIIKGNYAHVIKANSKLVFVPELYGGMTLNGTSSYPYYFFAGGLGENYINNNKSFPGYRFMELNFVEDGNYGFAQNMATAEISIRYNIYRSHYLIAFGGAGLAAQNIDNMFTDPYNFGGFGFKYSIKSTIGPLELAVHKSTESNLWNFYYNLGFWF